MKNFSLVIFAVTLLLSTKIHAQSFTDVKQQIAEYFDLQNGESLTMEGHDGKYYTQPIINVDILVNPIFTGLCKFKVEIQDDVLFFSISTNEGDYYFSNGVTYTDDMLSFKVKRNASGLISTLTGKIDAIDDPFTKAYLYKVSFQYNDSLTISEVRIQNVAKVFICKL